MDRSHKFMYKSGNDNKFYNNGEFFQVIESHIKKKINRNIHDGERKYMVNFIKKINPEILDRQPFNKIVDALSSTLVEEFNKFATRQYVVDTHETMKSQLGLTSESDGVHLVYDVPQPVMFDDSGPIGADPNKVALDNAIFGNSVDMEELIEGAGSGGVVGIGTGVGGETGSGVTISSVFGINNMTELSKELFNNPLKVGNAYLLLDTRHRILDDEGTLKFAWDHINNLTRQQGSVNSVGEIENIISATVYPVRMPYSASADNSYNRISMLVEEFTAQSVVAHENRRFHFMFNAETDGQWLNLDPTDFGGGKYKFTKPITKLDTVTISFGSPTEMINFDTDRLNASVTSIASPTEITTVADHNLLTGDRVYIETFTTNAPINDQTVINNVNDGSGHIVIVTSPTTFTIDVDTTPITNTLTGTITASSTTLGSTVTPGFNTTTIVGTATTFLADFTPNVDYIQILDGGLNPIFLVTAVTDNLNLTIDSVYLGNVGTFTYRKTGTTLTGVGTLFTSELKLGDNITITDGVTNPTYKIASIQNDTTLTLITPYDGANGAGFVYIKDNEIDSLIFNVYFGSKRFFINLELEFIVKQQTTG